MRRNGVKSSCPLAGDEGGQAVVEYILMLAVALTIVITISQGMRGSLLGFWKTLSREIAAACPGCPPVAEPRLGGK
jgi:Flp pilus assembly pilin Flp